MKMLKKSVLFLPYRLKKVLCAVSLVLCLALGLLPAVAAVAADTKEADAQTSAAEAAEAEEADAGKTWMSGLPDDRAISAISIPGTHGSGARFVAPSLFRKAQKQSLAEQMDSGFRYFDISLSVQERQKKGKKDRLIFTEDGKTCRKSRNPFAGPLTFTSAAKTAYAFLDENPSETLIFCLDDDDRTDDAASFKALLLEEVKDNSDRWYTENDIPELGTVRGKIVLANRFQTTLEAAVGVFGLNLDWADQDNEEPVDLPYAQTMINGTDHLWVQDRHRYNVAQKWDAVTDTLSNCEAGADTLSLNFLSTKGSSALGRPSYFAKRLNGKLLEEPLTAGTCYGVIVFDFGTAELARKVYETNGTL